MGKSQTLLLHQFQKTDTVSILNRHTLFIKQLVKVRNSWNQIRCFLFIIIFCNYSRIYYYNCIDSSFCCKIAIYRKQYQLQKVPCIIIYAIDYYLLILSNFSRIVGKFISIFMTCFQCQTYFICKKITQFMGWLRENHCIPI